MVTEREQQVLSLLKQDPLISQQKIADTLGISRSAAAGHIMNMTQKGLILGKGYILGEDDYAVVIGGTNMDILGQPTAALQLADSNVGTVTCSPGGVGRNIAENLARMGISTRLISAVGNDLYGKAVMQQSQLAGVDMQGCIEFSDATTSTYLSVLDQHNDMHVAINDMAILERLNAHQLARSSKVLERAALIVIDTNLSDSALEYILSNFSDKPIFVDTVSCAKATKILPYLNAIHTLKPNLSEAQQLANMQITDYEQLPELAQWFHGNGVQRVFFSLGRDGAFFSDKNTNEQSLVKSIPVSMANANGAGDAFLAALAYSFIHQLPNKESTQFAMAAAVLALSHIATINPNMSEASIQRVLKEYTC